MSLQARLAEWLSSARADPTFAEEWLVKYVQTFDSEDADTISGTAGTLFHL